MSNTLTHAEIELDILVKSAEPNNRPIIEEFIPEILALVKKFGESGQSGGSAPFTATAVSQAIKALCLHEPICAITGLDDEWVNVSESTGKERALFQNKRCSALFKEEGKQPYYLDAIAWKTETGSTWSGSATLPNGEQMLSRQFVKEFPFKPKTFIIDVIDTEIAPDDWEFKIKDENQLKAVFEYYKK